MVKRFRLLFLCIIMLLAFITPGITFAENTSLSEMNEDIEIKPYSQAEVDTFLAANTSFDPRSVRAVTEEEYEAIVKKAEEEMRKNPNKKVNVKKVLKELNLSDVTVIEEEEFNTVDIQPFFLAVGSVGFHDYSRSSIAFAAHPHVRNSIPLTTIDQIAGYVTGYSIVPGSTGYVTMYNSYFSEGKVTYGQTNILSKKSIAHYNKDSKMEINAIVKDGSKTTAVFNRIVSKTDGTFTK